MNIREWPYEEDDFMEIGETGLIPLKDGWFYNKKTKESIGPNGIIYDEHGEVVYHPFLDEEDYDQPYTEDDYEWYDK